MLLTAREPLFAQMPKKNIIFTGLILLVLASTVARNSIWLNDVTLYEETIRQNPRKSRAYNNLGRAYYLQGRQEDAKHMLERALQHGPGNAEAMNNLAVVHLDLKAYDKAIAYALRALQIQPGSADAHNTLGEVYMKLDEFDKALSHFRVSLSLGPSKPERYYNAAMALDRLGRQQESCGYLKNYLARVDADAHVEDVIMHMQRMGCR